MPNITPKQQETYLKQIHNIENQLPHGTKTGKAKVVFNTNTQEFELKDQAKKSFFGRTCRKLGYTSSKEKMLIKDTVNQLNTIRPDRIKGLKTRKISITLVKTLLLNAPLTSHNSTQPSLKALEYDGKCVPMASKEVPDSPSKERFNMLAQETYKIPPMERVGADNAKGPAHRFANTCTYSPTGTQVKLSTDKGDNLQNAFSGNFVKLSGEHGQKIIATQAPQAESVEKNKLDTIGQFWMANFDNDSKMIVDLTNSKDRAQGVVKYQPGKVNDTVTYTSHGVPINVTLKSEDSQGNGQTLYTFEVETDGVTKTMSRIHFDAWPDYGVVEPSELLTLIENIDKNTGKDDVLTMHCRAGIGRTGVAASALRLHRDFAGKELTEQEADKIIEETVVQGRADRSPSFVQTMDQYELLRNFFHEIVTIVSEENHTQDDIYANSSAEESIYANSSAEEPIYVNNAAENLDTYNEQLKQTKEHESNIEDIKFNDVDEDEDEDTHFSSAEEISNLRKKDTNTKFNNEDEPIHMSLKEISDLKIKDTK